MGFPRHFPCPATSLPLSPLRPPARACSRSGRAGFTLIEILVVVAIIAILAALIFPAIGGAQRSARLVTSVSNLRQWGVGFSAAVGDNDNEMPSDGTVGGFRMEDETAWFNRMPEKIKVAALKNSMDDPPKIGVKSLWINPEVPTSVNVPGIPFCYGFNDYLSTTNEPNMKITRVQYPSKTLLMAEKYPDISPSITPATLYAWYGAKTQSDPDAICNVLFVDGHVESVKRSVYGQPTAVQATSEDAYRVSPFTWLPFPDAQP